MPLIRSKKDVSKEIRRTTKIKGASCYICDYPDTETHHIVPVRILTGIVLRFRIAINTLIMPVVALCPNHHHKLHCLMGDRNGNTETTSHEKAKYKEIVNMAEYIDNSQYGDVYSRSVKEVKKTVKYNLEK